MPFYDIDVFSRVGEVHETSARTKFTIISVKKDKRNKSIYEIEFLESKFRSLAYYHNIKGKKVKDPYAPILCNVGYIGLAEYKGNEKIYHIWRGMIRRCYDPRRKDYERYGAKGVTVSDRWFSFENFLNDYKMIDGFDEKQFEQGKLHLDKDKKSRFSFKEYSLEKCSWLPLKENIRLQFL